ncbi:hypothetical protein PT974_12173 [Cladobotryum mycophilum]|uniref:Uncharacterized protein n=1 Tax=Cladobotryum mycophilum TaxID=491253 RepID=A0ABR0S873_9HYPO
MPTYEQLWAIVALVKGYGIVPLRSTWNLHSDLVFTTVTIEELDNFRQLFAEYGGDLDKLNAKFGQKPVKYDVTWKEYYVTLAMAKTEGWIEDPMGTVGKNGGFCGDIGWDAYGSARNT